MNALYVQLDLFDKDENARIWREIAAMNTAREKERKRLFREISELKKEIKALKAERIIEPSFQFKTID